jgi:tetratricopeptide (TPR) repeat protein
MTLNCMGRHAQVIKDVQVALRQEPDNGELFRELALAYDAAGDSQKARDAFDNALRADSDDLQTKFDYAWFLSTSPDPQVRNGKRARALAEQATKLADGNLCGKIVLAVTEAECGNFQRAQGLVEQSVVGLTGATPEITNKLQELKKTFDAQRPYHFSQKSLPTTPGESFRNWYPGRLKVSLKAMR